MLALFYGYRMVYFAVQNRPLSCPCSPLVVVIRIKFSVELQSNTCDSFSAKSHLTISSQRTGQIDIESAQSRKRWCGDNTVASTSVMSTTTALKVSPSTNAASASTPTKDRSAKRNSTLLESTNTVSTNLGGENKLKISPEDITSPLELTDYVSIVSDAFYGIFY